ncbi:MAG TPA: aldehyde ferredoxin oxidoreductase family protein [Candidatus Methylomirabilis sp.]|nr:aldehyde ferredoxin oxidoreductase family protein [Candidatus Methylomirabilis sp.]
MPKGYVGKLLWVDLTSGKVTTTGLDQATARGYLAGSGLGAKLIRERLKTIDGPLAPSNPLCFLPGLLCGTVVPGANRTSVCALSPATGAWGEARAGGAWAPMLKYAGYDGVIFTGKARQPVYVWIEDGRVEVRPAEKLWGKGFYETDARLLQETHRDAIVAGIGPAGETRSRMACVMFEGKYARSAGRTGMGAVMGSKNLKAVVVRGTGGIPVADPGGLMQRAAAYGGKEKSRFKRNFELGTAGGVVAVEAVGDMPIRNFMGGRWTEKAGRISGQTMWKKYGKHERSCLSCPSNCTLVAAIPGTQVGHAPEYETIGAFGSMCENDSIEVIGQCNELCNDYGLDTISAGNTIAFAMEAFDKGLLSEQELGGIRLTWGNGEAILALLHKIGRREGIGDILADGSRPAAERLGKDFGDMVVEVKGVEIPMHDPRAYWSNAVNYAVANRGACHMEGVTFTVESGLPFPDLGYTAPMDPYITDGKAQLAVKMHDLMALYDGLGICKFYIVVSYGPTAMAEWLNYCTGWGLTPDELMRTGERVFNTKRLINVGRGLRRKDDSLPKRLLTVPQRDDIGPVDPQGMERMLSEYYHLRGWDEKGVPTRGRLKALQLA